MYWVDKKMDKTVKKSSNGQRWDYSAKLAASYS